MAKSLRSKVKRSFRANKRQDSVYAATAAARLDRLHAKLSAVVNADVERDTEDNMEQDGEEDEAPGWSWFTTLGLLDPQDITPDRLWSIADTTPDSFRTPRWLTPSSHGKPADADDQTLVNGSFSLFFVIRVLIESNSDTMQIDSKRVSTHGPRGSRREEWRLSKGLPARPTSKGMNRQGGIAAKRKAGRSKRRR
ncbi:hypothetical protein MIND_00709200 [Mycena indigotica]|uniref:DUF2423 domain-containing protein n=1 Tax=Mycena indigotica TaxID=2126181 RepID=A0A8H6W0X3_9AGAR|nr:uncharacterized protein MIND_00709200 [Mycena indigotica]KAF7301439.1 hypothetical protein MIND_00709200 [Mycena indigotica]